jgi:hypothetical protein
MPPSKSECAEYNIHELYGFRSPVLPRRTAYWSINRGRRTLIGHQVTFALSSSSTCLLSTFYFSPCVGPNSFLRLLHCIDQCSPHPGNGPRRTRTTGGCAFICPCTHIVTTPQLPRRTGATRLCKSKDIGLADKGACGRVSDFDSKRFGSMGVIVGDKRTNLNALAGLERSTASHDWDHSKTVHQQNSTHFCRSWLLSGLFIHVQ